MGDRVPDYYVEPDVILVHDFTKGGSITIERKDMDPWVITEWQYEKDRYYATQYDGLAQSGIGVGVAWNEYKRQLDKLQQLKDYQQHAIRSHYNDGLGSMVLDWGRDGKFIPRTFGAVFQQEELQKLFGSHK